MRGYAYIRTFETPGVKTVGGDVMRPDCLGRDGTFTEQCMTEKRRRRGYFIAIMANRTGYPVRRRAGRTAGGDRRIFIA